MDTWDTVCCAAIGLQLEPPKDGSPELRHIESREFGNECVKVYVCICVRLTDRQLHTDGQTQQEDENLSVTLCVFLFVGGCVSIDR